jgi:hypothetical protein
VQTALLRHGLNGSREARLRPLDGADALAVQVARASGTPAELATLLLERTVVSLGALCPPSAADLRALTVPDRERLLLALYEASFGPGIELTVPCPACQELAELALPRDALLGEHAGGPPQLAIEADGRHLRVRLPTGADQEAAARNPGEAASVFWHAVVAAHDAAVVSPERCGETVDAALARLDPLVTGAIDLSCPACAATIPAVLDGLALILARLPSREQLDAGTLAIARASGWGEAAIEALPLSRRARYLQHAALPAAEPA